jgi:uncharacterized repeat protein (TIGR01451 family)
MIGGKRSTILLFLALWPLLGISTPGPNAAQPGTAEPPVAPGGLAPRATDNVMPGSDANELPTPVVSIQVHVPATASAGQELEYKLIVENRSRAAAHHVLVRNKVSENATFVKATPEPKDHEPELRWDLGTMPGGTRKEISLVVKPTGAGDVENTARVMFEHGQRVKTTLSKPQLRVREVGPAQGVVGELLKYQLEVTNVGSVEAVDVLLTNTLPDGLAFSDSQPTTPGNNPLSWKLGAIAAGQTRRVTYQVIAEKAGTWSTQARATAQAGVPAADATTTIAVGEPKLTVVKTGPARRLVNRPATYQITISNPGTIALTGVRVIDKIPADITFLSANGGGQRVADQVQWDLGAIPAGGRKVVQMVVRSGKAGELTNVAEARADHNLQARDAVLTTFDNPKTLTLEIEKNIDPVDQGREAVYTIRALNPTSRPATNLGVTITVPEELRILDARGPTQGETKQQKVTFAPVAALGAGQETAYTVRAQAANPGAARLKAELTSDSLPQGTVISQEENVTILQSK